MMKTSKNVYYEEKKLTRFYWPLIRSHFSVLSWTRRTRRSSFSIFLSFYFHQLCHNRIFLYSTTFLTIKFFFYGILFFFRLYGVRLCPTKFFALLLRQRHIKNIKRCVYEIRNVWYENVCIYWMLFNLVLPSNWHAETSHALLVCFDIRLCCTYVCTGVSY